MDQENMKEVIKALKKRDNFLITSHVNPEGDSIGSQLALNMVLKKIGKASVIVNQDNVPDNLKFLPGAALIKHEVPEDFRPEVVIVADCPVKERSGKINRLISDKEHFIMNIDHHVSNEFFGDINWVESGASSVGEMIFRMVEAMGVDIDKDIAKVIYTALVTDTGMFSYDNTSEETHRIAGKIISLGVQPKEIHGEIFERKSIPEIRLLGKVLSTLKVDKSGKLAYISLTGDMYREEGVENISTDEFINFPRSIKGVEIAVFFKENQCSNGKISVSFRSAGKIDVNVVASKFGGGGHALASGCVLDCSLGEAQERVLSEARKVLEGIS